MRPKTNFGFRAKHTSGPMPRRSMTPGRKPSINASADSTSLSNVSTPSGFLRSIAMFWRPRCKMSNAGPSGAGPRTACARSTRMTSAPMSDNIMAAKGPGPMPAISTIRKPVSGPVIPSSYSVASGALPFGKFHMRRHGTSHQWQ